jgi:hypothetical protein
MNCRSFCFLSPLGPLARETFMKEVGEQRMADSLRQVLCFQVGRDRRHSSFDPDAVTGEVAHSTQVWLIVTDVDVLSEGDFHDD